MLEYYFPWGWYTPVLYTAWRFHTKWLWWM